MAEKLKVEVVSPDRRVLSEAADEVIAPGADGLFGVRYGHTPYLALLEPGPLTIIDGSTQKRFFVAGGFAEATGERVRVLAESAELLEGIDIAAAKRRLEASQQKLDAISPDAPEYAVQAKVVKIDARRVEVAEKR